MDLHDKIMNIQADNDKSIEYKEGHRDARHAAAELVAAELVAAELAAIDIAAEADVPTCRGVPIRLVCQGKIYRVHLSREDGGKIVYAKMWVRGDGNGNQDKYWFEIDPQDHGGPLHVEEVLDGPYVIAFEKVES